MSLNKAIAGMRDLSEVEIDEIGGATGASCMCTVESESWNGSGYTTTSTRKTDDWNLN